MALNIGCAPTGVCKVKPILTRPDPFDLPRRLSLLAIPILVLALTTARVTPVAAQGVTIGLYTDAGGSTCSFSGDDTGVLVAYVVVRPGGAGVRAVHFMAPIPNCFNATWLGETPPIPLIAVGDSQNGVTVTSTECETQPINVLQIFYMRSGGTSPCCPFPLVADPSLGYLEAIDCSFASNPMSSVISHFNADQTCACEQVPPLQPFNPDPVDGIVGVALTPTLRWDATDYDGDLAEFDVYFGTDSLPPLAAAGIVTQTYPPAPLAEDTRYFWRVVARDAQAHETSGPVWTFTTSLPPMDPVAPVAPFSPNPADHAAGQLLADTLSWDATDANNNLAEYDVYFGTAANPPLAAAGVLTKFYELAPLDPVTDYYWRVVARDSTDLESSGPVWTFSTNHPPAVPDAVFPLDAATNVPSTPTLEWSSSDADGDALVFDVYLGTEADPPLVASDVAQPQYNAPLLDGSTTFYWRIVARDNPGNETTGPTWTFTTAPVPVLFTGFIAQVRAGGINVSWVLQSDEAMESYTLYRRVDGASQPALLTTAPVNATTGSYLDRTVEGGKTYRYEMLVRTRGGDEFRSQTVTVEMPSLEVSLGQNHPNPFNPQTTIPYVVPGTGTPVRVRVVIYDASGRKVRVLVDENQTGGAREVIWNGDDAGGATVSSGIYFCVLQAGKERRTQKLVLLK